MKPSCSRLPTETPGSVLRKKSKAGKVLRMEPVAEEEDSDDSSSDEVCLKVLT